MRKITIFISISLFSIMLGWLCWFVYCKTEKLRSIDSIDKTLSQSVKLDIKRFDKQIFACQDLAQIDTLLAENPLLTQHFLGAKTNEDRKNIAERLYGMVQNVAIQALYKEVQEKFNDFSALETQLAAAFQRIQHDYPDFTIPPIYTLITGMGTDLYVSDSVIVIGLDFFIGEGASVRPHMPAYLLHTYEPDYIVPKIMFLLAGRFNVADATDHTLLHDMVYVGKCYFFCKSILPSVPEAAIIGYTNTQWKDTDQHQRFVWQHFVDKQLFYTTNQLTKQRYIGPRPNTLEIGPDCPGNIGGWLGWQIVNSYMKHNPAVTLPQLMQIRQANDLFIQSKFRPR